MGAELAKVYSLEVGETRAECTITLGPNDEGVDVAEIRYCGQLPNGGWFDGSLTIDRGSFDRGTELARAHGLTTAHVGALVQRVLGYKGLVTIEPRLLRAR